MRPLSRAVPWAVLAVASLLVGATHPGAEGAALAAPVPARIMAAGDSLTLGVVGGRPIDGTLGGYRARLQARLGVLGTPFDMVGSLKAGPGSADPDHEGWPGWRISQVDAELQRAVPVYRPDYLLLLVGTNDVEQDARGVGEPLVGAPGRLRTLLTRVWEAWPVRRVFVSTLPQIASNYDPNAAGRIGWLNDQIRSLVAELRAAGRPIEIVEGATLPPAELSDGIHPTPAGYDYLGNLWADALTPYLVPASGCDPRPPVQVTVQRGAPGELRAAVRAMRLIREIRVAGTSNARIADIVVVDREASFVVQRTGPGAATLPLIVVDECGDWPTFVGGGAAAF